MIDVLAFSKDRAAQLDLLLRSIDRHAPDLYSTITVLFTYSTAEYEAGYERCFDEHSPVKFILQDDFEADVRRWLGLAGDVISFLVDDDVFYRGAPFDPRMFDPIIFSYNDAHSLRGGDYDYPFSVDGNIYWKDHIVRLLDGLRFNDPTELEAHGHNARQRLPFTEVKPIPLPCIVGVPANRVSASSRMPHMDVSTRMFNDAYLDGRKLELPPVEGDLPAHANLGYLIVDEDYQ